VLVVAAQHVLDEALAVDVEALHLLGDGGLHLQGGDLDAAGAAGVVEDALLDEQVELLGAAARGEVFAQVGAGGGGLALLGEEGDDALVVVGGDGRRRRGGGGGRGRRGGAGGGLRRRAARPPDDGGDGGGRRGGQGDGAPARAPAAASGHGLASCVPWAWT